MRQKHKVKHDEKKENKPSISIENKMSFYTNCTDVWNGYIKTFHIEWFISISMIC